MRLLAPTLGVLLLAALIGCGGGGTGPSFGDAADTSTSTTSGDTTTTGGTTGTAATLPPTAGNYLATYSGNDGTTSFTGHGTAVAASNGGLVLTYAAADTSDATARTVSATVAADGTVTGTVTVGANAAATISTGTASLQSAGVYRLTTAFTNAASLVETDTTTVTLATTSFTGADVGTDDQGAAYAGAGTATISGGNVLGLTYTSTRNLVGGITQTHTLSTTLLANGTFSGSLGLGFSSTPATGTWTLTSAGILTLKLAYVNPNFVNSSGRSPTVAETLTMARR